MNIYARKSALVAVLIVSSALDTARAEQISGQVKADSGQPLSGVIVTLTDPGGHSESVYSDDKGNWRLNTTTLGQASLRARAPLFDDTVQPVTLPAKEPYALTIKPLTELADISDRLTASAHVSAIHWKDPVTRRDFVSQCQFCHQMGNEWTRTERTPEVWKSIIDRMQGYGSLLTHKDEDEIREALAANFNGQPLQAVQRYDLSPELSSAEIREWAFGAGLNYVHDIELGKDGRIYGVDMSSDKLWVLDFATNQTEAIDLPPNGLPLGGMFSGGVAPLGTFAAHHGPHSIIEGPDHKLYMTCSLGGEIGVFDLGTRKTTFLPIGGDAIYPHTLRFDKEGILWFTLAASNQIGRLDPKTAKFILIDTPSNGFWRWVSDAMLPTILKVSSWFGKKDLYVTLSHHKMSGEGYRVLNVPYGIDISPVDGSVWYSKLYADRIGRLDPKTLKVQEWPTPHAGPRRMRFDKDGNLWIPSFGEGYLMKFNTRTLQFEKNYKLPTLAENEYETPYAVAVHPRTQEVWVSANLSDRTLRFNPKSETFIAYPSPTRVTFVRDFIFLPDGNVCTSNSNLPALAIEGQRPKIFCIKPYEFPPAN